MIESVLKLNNECFAISNLSWLVLYIDLKVVGYSETLKDV